MNSNLRQDNPRIRWWPATIILLLDIGIVGWLWVFFSGIRQEKVLLTLLAQVVTLLLLAIWLLFGSRLRWKSRLTTFAGLAMSLTLFFFLFPFKEFTGDLVPTFGWRWAEKSYQTETVDLNSKSETDKLLTATVFSYPQFLGPERNGKTRGTRLDPDWSAQPPKQLWKQPIGEGASSFAISGNFAVTQEQRADDEMVVCYDLKSGKTRWQHSDKARFDSVAFVGGIGPKATPTISGNRVYTLGATGILNCMNLKDGKLIWSKNILNENNAVVIEWGMTGSPLLLDSLVVVSAGGTDGRSLVAYHRNSGEQIWSAGNDRAGYSSPLIATIAGVRQILIFNWEYVAAHNPKTGKILWKFPWTGDTQRVAQPVVLPEDRVFITTGYGVGSKLIKINQDTNGNLSPVLLWESKRMKAKFSNVIAVGEFIYGLDDGILACIDLQEGKRQWKRGRYGHGQMILVDNLLLITTEKGDVVLVEPNPEQHKELARFTAIKGKTWNNPALAGPYLLVRNGQEAACYKLPVLN